MLINSLFVNMTTPPAPRLSVSHRFHQQDSALCVSVLAQARFVSQSPVW